jgi:hypothetical protein
MTLILENEGVFPPCLSPNCSGMVETPHRDLSARGLQAVQVLSKAVRDKGHFTQEAETVFPSYFPSHCSRMSGTSYALPTLQVWWKWITNKGHFTQAQKRVFLISPRNAAGWHTEHRVPRDISLQAVEVWSKSVSNEGHFTLKAKRVFRSYRASHWS